MPGLGSISRNSTLGALPHCVKTSKRNTGKSQYHFFCDSQNSKRPMECLFRIVIDWRRRKHRQLRSLREWQCDLPRDVDLFFDLDRTYHGHW
jgi:hypothetical protein